MIYEVREVQKDAKNLNQNCFFEKYFLSDDCWYIEEYLGHGADSKAFITKYKQIIAEGLKIEESCIHMVGSAKWGFSLSPSRAGLPSKLFKSFCDDGFKRKMSDIDIAIVSKEIFEKYWNLYRVSYRSIYESVYRHVMVETYRGFVNEKNVTEIDRCRPEWNDMISPIRVKLQKEMLFRHEINFRVYRSEFDFKDYSKNIYRELQGRS